MMADDQLKNDIKSILNLNGVNVSKERPVKGAVKKELFSIFIENYRFANDRTLLLKTEHSVDFVNYEEPFVQSIEALMKIFFTKTQIQLIEWWLYEKWSSPDGVLQLTNTETGEELPTDTPDELWDLVQTLK